MAAHVNGVKPRVRSWASILKKLSKVQAHLIAGGVATGVEAMLRWGCVVGRGTFVCQSGVPLGKFDKGC